MPWNEVMHKWGAGTLRSGNKETGAPVKSQAQAVAIMLSEKRKAEAGNKEYQAPRRRLPKG
jgi:hypothetical protein